MRKFAILAFVFFLSACATSSGVVTGGAQQPRVKTARQESSRARTNPTKMPDAARNGTFAGDQDAVRTEDGAVDETDDISSILSEDKLQDFDIPIVFNDAVRYYIVYFTTEKRKVFGNWLRRARRYVPIITEILKEQGLPEDLVYLAMIESGFNPKAYSSANACGPWQFIHATGGRYGLTVNYWIDERRDPEKSTVAAAKYLKDLFNQFGCWYLAAAGYNAGEGRVEKAIEKHNTNDFWELAKYNALPKETREYIPKLIAAAIIAKDPEKYGFGALNYDPPVRFLEVKVPPGTPLSAIAEAADMSVIDVRSRNPEILRGVTPPNVDGYAIKLPSQVDRDEFEDNLQLALRKERRIKSVLAYRVKRRDTLAKIMKKYGVKEEELHLVNNCEDNLHIRPGMVLSIPRFSSPARSMTASAQSAHKEKEIVEAKMVDIGGSAEPDLVATKANLQKPRKQDRQKKPDTGKIYHVVKKGESLTRISTMYGIELSDLRAYNRLKADRVFPNMKLRLVSHSLKKQRARVKYHVVKKGETLASISSKYDTDVISIKSINKLKGDKLYPRMKLKVVSGEG
jgi:membrane-bound lytic murein transglycosylase D